MNLSHCSRLQEDELQRGSEFHNSLSPTKGVSKDSFKLRAPQPPPPTSNIIPSRSKIFDSTAGFEAGHRRKPEIHNAMSTSQLQEVLCQYFMQASKDVRSMNIATESSGIVLSPARREAQRRMTGNFDGSKSGAWSIAEWLGGKVWPISQAISQGLLSAFFRLPTIACTVFTLLPADCHRGAGGLKLAARKRCYCRLLSVEG